MITSLYLNIYILVQILHLPSQPICDHMFANDYLYYIFSYHMCPFYSYLEDRKVLEYTVNLFPSESNHLQAGYESEIFPAQQTQNTI